MAGSMLTITRLIIVAASFSLLAAAQGHVFTSEQETKVVNFIENLLQCRGVVGATVAVVSRGRTWTQGFGWADREAGVKVNSSTLFGIGSITKQFSSALLSLFINETGKFTWRTRLLNILGKDFKLTDDYVTRHVTIEDVLLHRSGIKSTDIPMFSGLPDGLSRDEYIRRLRYFPMSYPFREKFEYNNLVFAITGRLAEVMAGDGRSWEELLEARLLRPAGMNASRVVTKTFLPGQGQMAHAYVQVDDQVVQSDPAIYSLSPLESVIDLASSAEDMARWMHIVLNNGRTPEGVQVLNSARLAEMTSPYISTYPMFEGSFLRYPVYPVTYETVDYGYAWMTGSYRGYHIKLHSGGLYGYISWIALIPEFNFGIFVSINGPGSRNASQFYRLAFYYIADILILAQTGSSEQPWLNETTSCQFPAPWNPPSAPSNDSGDALVDESLQFQRAERYAGSYGSYAFGEIEISLNGTGSLNATFNRLQGPLYRPRNGSDDTVGLMEISGRLAFMSRPEPTVRSYVSFTFARADGNSGDRFQEIHVSSDYAGEALRLLFTRGVKFYSPPPEDPAPSGCLSLNHSSCLARLVLLLCLLSRNIM